MGRCAPALAAIAGALVLLPRCSSSGVSCPSSTRLHGGVCKAICARDSECLVNERCDPLVGVCVARADADAGSPSNDSGANDSGANDGGAYDSGAKDEGPRDAVGGDAMTSDEGVLDAKP